MDNPLTGRACLSILDQEVAKTLERLYQLERVRGDPLFELRVCLLTDLSQILRESLKEIDQAERRRAD